MFPPSFIVTFQYWRQKKLFFVSPPHISRHALVKQKFNLFSAFSDSIRKTLTDIEISQIVEADLQRFLAWFIIDYLQHNLELSARARKIFLITKCQRNNAGSRNKSRVGPRLVPLLFKKINKNT